MYQNVRLAVLLVVVEQRQRAPHCSRYDGTCSREKSAPRNHRLAHHHQDHADHEHHSENPLGTPAVSRRFQEELGQREIPDLGRRTNVEIMSGRSREAETRVATDGGRAVAPEPQGASTEDAPARPSDCSCLPSFEDLPCWECYRAGYETPNPDTEADDGDDEVSG